MSNTHFAIAIHTLTLLALEKGGPLSATHIAGSINTHPVFLRRVIAPLVRAGIVESTRGASGGISLLHAPDTITLQDVFAAVRGEEHFLETHPDPHPECPVGGKIEGILRPHFTNAEQALQSYFGSITVADMLEEIENAV